MTMQFLPLNTLCLSKLNVRTTERDADIQALAEDIAARGLKQNLVVVPAHFMTGKAKQGWDDKWEVIAGGRRFQALQLLVADGRLPEDHAVPCLLEEREGATETSLSENLHKVSMNPADEFAAFQAIIDAREIGGATRAEAIAACAKRFGKTVKHVEGRLRLAALAPEILDALRTDAITLDAAKAYALTTDHDLQRKVFATRAKDKYNGHQPNSIRNGIRSITLPLDAPLVTFVGLVEYQAQGGRIEAEMFMGSEGQQRVADVPLLESMARKIAEPLIAAQAKADGYKSGMLTKDFSQYPSWPKEPAGYVRASYWEDEPSKAKLKKSIAVYGLNKDGTGLERLGRFKPADETKTRAPQVPERDWKAERRLRAINELATQLAAKDLVARTGFVHEVEACITWPDVVSCNYINLIENGEDTEDDLLVAVQIRISKSDAKQHLAAAEAEHDRLAALEANPQPNSEPGAHEADAAVDLVDSEAAEA